MHSINHRQRGSSDVEMLALGILGLPLIFGLGLFVVAGVGVGVATHEPELSLQQRIFQEQATTGHVPEVQTLFQQLPLATDKVVCNAAPAKALMPCELIEYGILTHRTPALFRPPGFVDIALPSFAVQKDGSAKGVEVVFDKEATPAQRAAVLRALRLTKQRPVLY